MPIVLVHGNPETAAIWDEVRTQIGRDDVIALSPPGFGASVPEGFDATSDAYLTWLLGELETVAGPIDLVGHDWGGGHVMRAVLAHPELMRSWAIDIGGCLDPDYVWHERAQAWQTPGKGEEAIAQQLAAPTEMLAAGYEQLGMSRSAAMACAAAFDAQMGRCILALYRSAVQPNMANWAAEMNPARSRPGLILVATEDHYTGGEVLARRTAERAGASVTVLDGLGHWWMCQDPARGAAALTAFFAGVGSN
jgi:pimeloyl-ACP methyl ester carboxylesterase